MTRAMHPLLRLALFVCPREFRRQWAYDLSADLDPRRPDPLPLVRTCANVAWTGVRLHAENVWRDLSYAARVLAKTPVFFIVATLTIALAIAANLSAFSILKNVLLNPLPYPHGDRLTFISQTFRGEDQSTIDYPNAHDLALRNRTFDGIAVETSTHATLTGMGRPVELPGWSVGGEYFSVLGVRAEIGRLLGDKDVGAQNIVISDRLWRTRFSSSAGVIGRRLTLDGRDYSIVGVAPSNMGNPGAGFIAAADYWMPIDLRSANWRGYHAFWAIGRMRPHVSIMQAQRDLSRVASELAGQYPNFDAQRGVLVRSLYDALIGPTRMLVLMFYAAAILVLIIAAANIVNLLLVRAAARERDLALRVALGATRARIASQLAAETGLVAALGLVVGIVAASACLAAVSTLLTSLGDAYGMDMHVPGWGNVGMDPVVVLYAVAIAAFFAFGAAMVPPHAQGARLAAPLHATPRAGGAAHGGRLRAALTIAETVLAFAVLCSGVLLLKSYVKLTQTPVGFTESHVYAVRVGLPPSRYGRTGESLRFYNKALDALRALPGIRDAAEALSAGLGSSSSTNYSLTRAIGVGADSGPEQDVEFNSVTPDFFTTLDIPLLAGRSFTRRDTASSQSVAIVSKTFALQHFGSVARALGKHVSVGDSSGGGFPLRRIVGVVGSVRHVLSDAPAAEVYAPFAQITFPGTIVVRTKTSEGNLGKQIYAALSNIDPLLGPPQIDSFAEMRIANGLATRMAAAVFLALSAVALLLALAGVYGVVAYNVERRTHEFGIRRSLGAPTSAIAMAVLRDALLIAVTGIALGTVLAALLAHGLTDLLYQTSALDADSFAVAAIVLLAAVFGAACVPTLRATSVQPAAALRSE